MVERLTNFLVSKHRKSLHSCYTHLILKRSHYYLCKLGPGEKMGGETHGVGWGQRNYHPGCYQITYSDLNELSVL